MARRIKGSREEEAWMTDEQLAHVERADSGTMYGAAVPTQMVSNGEYFPHKQTKKQKRVEARVKELAAEASRKLGITRRQFLAGTGGLAASFVAMNEVFGRYFDVRPIEMFEPAAFAQSGVPSDVFIFDDQLHVVPGSSHGARSLRALAQGPTAPGFQSNPGNPRGLQDEHGDPWKAWNPNLIGAPLNRDTFHVVQFIKDVFLDSQVTVGLLSNVTAELLPLAAKPRPARNLSEALRGEMITAQQIVAVRDFVNKVAGSPRMLAHGLLYTGVGNLEFIEQQIEELKPDSWKGHNVANAAKVDRDPSSVMRRWRLDDATVAYPTYEVISRKLPALASSRPGLKNICVHKGLAPDEDPSPEIGHPADIPRAARDWPGLNFIIYHSCIRPAFFMLEALEDVKSGRLRNGVPDIRWTTEFIELVRDLPNVYAELGTTWASTVITFPTVAAHLMGQLMKGLGQKRILFGSDSAWYGSPQWQIEALWRFQIPDDIRRQYDYPELTEAAKRDILGLNSARLYQLSSVSTVSPEGAYRPVPPDYASRMPDDFKKVMEFPGYSTDNFSRARGQYLARGAERQNVRYGWIRT